MPMLPPSAPDSPAITSTQVCFSPLGRVLALIYGGLFALLLWVAYRGALPNWFQGIPYYDKSGHVILYAIATYLGHGLLNGRHIRWGNWLIPFFPLLFAVFTIVEELSQGLSPNRTLDALDLICSLLGVALGYGLAQRGGRGKQGQTPGRAGNPGQTD